MKKLLSLFVLMSAATFSRELTLEKAIDTALENGKTIKTAELSKENANLNVRRAFKAALPTVTYNGQYEKFEHTKGKKAVDLGNADVKSGYAQSIGVYQPLFMGGAITGGILGAQASQSMADITFLMEKRDLRLEVIELYSNIIIAQKDLKVLESSMTELKARYAKQEEQLKQKLITKADLLKTEYSLLDLESQIEAKKTEIKVSEKDMKLKLMIPENEELVLQEFEVPTDLLSGINFEEDLENALQNSLSARFANDSVDLAKAQKMVSASSMLPQVNAFATYGTAGETHHFNNGFEDSEWRGGISVKWDVFNFGSGLDEYYAAKNSQKIEETNKEITSDNIKLSVTSSYREVVRLDLLRNSRQKAYEAAKENFKIDTERYNAGLISTVDYLLSESQYREAAVGYNAAVLDYYVAFEKYRSLLI